MKDSADIHLLVWKTNQERRGFFGTLQYFGGKSKVSRDIAILGLTSIRPAKKSGYKVVSIPADASGPQHPVRQCVLVCDDDVQ